MTSEPLLSFSQLAVTLPHHGGDDLTVIDDVSCNITTSEFVSIIGPNGCGKSTLLRAIAGLIPISGGEIIHRGRPVRGPDSSRLLVFQQPTLFPWKTVRANIDFALRATGVPRKTRGPRIEAALQLVGLARFGGSYPWLLSGGMQQRAELARAFALEAEMVLLDEPFAALDSLAREVMQEELVRIREETGAAFIMVTHDIREAAFLGDLILVLSALPATVIKVVRSKIPLEQRLAWRRKQEFADFCHALTEILREEVSRADDVQGAMPHALR